MTLNRQSLLRAIVIALVVALAVPPYHDSVGPWIVRVTSFVLLTVLFYFAFQRSAAGRHRQSQ